MMDDVGVWGFYGGLARRGERAEEGAGGALDLMESSMRVVDKCD